MSFSVEVDSVDFKFSSGHFVAFRGFRERLHGHNYTVRVKLEGERVNADGYVVDFGDVKDVVKQACKDLNEYVLLPAKSDVLRIFVRGEEITSAADLGSHNGPRGDVKETANVIVGSDNSAKKRKLEPPGMSKKEGDGANYFLLNNKASDTDADSVRLIDGNAALLPLLAEIPATSLARARNVEVLTEDGSYFSLPEIDCKLLPLVHTTAEELAQFLWADIHGRLLENFGCDLRGGRGIHTMEVSVAERPIQKATYRKAVP